MKPLIVCAKRACFVLVVPLFLASCKKEVEPANEAQPAAKESPAKAKPLRKILVNYWRSTCEAPTYVAKLKGFFAEEGIEAELAVVNAQEVLNEQGKLVDSQKRPAQAAMFFPLHLLMMLQGAPIDYVVTAGLHQGCMQTMALGDAKRTQDPKSWKDATIGVPLFGTNMGGKFVKFLSTDEFYLRTVLKNAGLDPDKDVKFVDYSVDLASSDYTNLTDGLVKQLKDGKFDMVAIWDPMAQSMIDKNGLTHVASLTHTPPFSRVFCCFLAVDREIVEKDPELARAITRAYLAASRWVAKEPRAAAELIYEAGYSAYVGDKEHYINTVAAGLASYVYAPNPDVGKDLEKMMSWAESLGLVKADDQQRKARIATVGRNLFLDAE
jgi:ABC-type nitrate/sulfonate/bicarbonate transport system substrate-binding protein